MGGSVSVESHLSVKDIYYFSAQTGFTVAEVEYFFRRFRVIKTNDVAAMDPTDPDETLASPNVKSPLKSNTSGREKDDDANITGDAGIMVDNETGAAAFLDQLNMDWLLARIYFTIFPHGKKITFSDFLNAIKEWRRKTSKEKLEFYFTILDYDEDGVVSASDLSVIIQHLYHHKFAVGNRIRIRNDGRVGTLQYLGEADFAFGVWAGIQLDERLGKHNGTVKGKQYFTCEPGYGVFVQYTFIEPLEHYSLACDILNHATGYEGTLGLNKEQFVVALERDSYLLDLIMNERLF
ncbi:Dynactin subunit 1 [Irineochytrium annulatum]|nr:Dynactin subunit 1 [Irineochytrium annulatum]